VRSAGGSLSRGIGDWWGFDKVMLKYLKEEIKVREDLGKYLNKIACGDCLQLVKEIPTNSINLVITSPPYFKQRDYGMGYGNEETQEEYLSKLYDLFHECVRVVVGDGSIVFNLGDKYDDGSLMLIPYKFALGILERENAKLVNDITWIKTNPTPRQFKRRLVSSTEPFFHFVKSDDYFYNIDDFQKVLKRRRKTDRRTQNNTIGNKYFSLIRNSGLTEDQKILAIQELNNVIEEVKGGKIESFRMKISGIHSPAFGGQEGGRKSQMEKKGFTIIRIKGDPMKKDIIECSVETLKGTKHPAIYPEFIICEIMKLLTRRDDIVLDPFMGSGTTALACKRLGRNYIGFEINQDYCEYAKERLSSLSNFEQMKLEI